MRIAIISVVVALTISAHAKNENLDGKWVAISSRAIGERSYTLYDGLILDIRSKTFIISSVFSDSSKSFQAHKNGRTIKLDGKVFGKVHFVSQDSLVVDFDGRTRVRFIPVRIFRPDIQSANLPENPWILSWSDQKDTIRQRIDFLNERWHDGSSSRTAITHERKANYKYQEREKWTFNNFQGEWFLTLTQGQFHPIIYQVTKVYEDSLKLNCLVWQTNNEFTLNRVPKKAPQELDLIIKQLAERTWRTFEVLTCSSSEDTIDENYPTGYYRDTTLIKRAELIERKVSIRFGDKLTFQICVDSNLFWTTSWKLSKDGSYVIINKGKHPFDYIEINSIGDNELVIGKADNFSTGVGNGYVSCYYELRLR